MAATKSERRGTFRGSMRTIAKGVFRSALPARHRLPVAIGWLARALVSVALAASLLVSLPARAGTYFWFGDDNNNWSQIVGPGGTNWSSSPDFNNGTGGATA